MEKENRPLFRKSVSGYNKSDVNQYIVKLDRDAKELLQKTRDDDAKAADLLRAELLSLSSSLAAKESECATLTSRLVGTERAIDSLSDEADRLTAQVAQLERILSEKDRQLTALSEEKAQALTAASAAEEKTSLLEQQLEEANAELHRLKNEFEAVRQAAKREESFVIEPEDTVSEETPAESAEDAVSGRLFRSILRIKPIRKD